MEPTASKREANYSQIMKRGERAREIVRREGLDAILVLNHADIRWLTGLTSSNAAVIVTPEKIIVATDFRYVAAATDHGFEVAKIEQSMWSDLGRITSEVTGSGAVGYAPSDLSHRAFLDLTETLADGVQLRALEGAIAQLRLVKDTDEIVAIRKAAALLDGAYEMVAEEGLLGRREKDVAWMIERYLREAGATALSFDSIVAGGTNGAFPHHSPGDDEIPNDTLVTIDIGCIVDGYCSDCTRTFAVGNPSQQLRDIYAITLEAQEKSLAAVRAGATGVEVDAIARTIISDAGYGDNFGHGLGHGVGVEIHEAPRLSRTSPDTLEAGMVVTVEPGIYVPGLGGVRIEDLVVVTDDGYDLLTHYTKQLVSV